MLSRITEGWTVMRAFYVIMGVFIIAQAAMEGEWLVTLIGGYFASMGLFNYGCASGACAVPAKQAHTNSNKTTDVEYQEIKSS